MESVAWFTSLLQGGLSNLAAYLAAHVLLCLVPAFYIAGGLTTFVPKESITRFLGRSTPKFISYPAAALAGSVLAVCSCTIVPLFAGIYRKGAGLGPAITFLFFAPAANILALAYTGIALGPDLALARLFLSLAFGIGIGLIMALIFNREDAAHDQAADALFAAKSAARRAPLIFLLALAALLLVGTLKVELLTSTYAQVTLPFTGMDRAQQWLNTLAPFDPGKGEEGLSVHGLVLIGLLTVIGLAAWRGLENILDGFNGWAWATLGLVVATLLIAAAGMRPHAVGLDILFTGRWFGVLMLLAVLIWLIRYQLSTDEVQAWLWESWRFVKQIFPLLIVGVFAVGVIRPLIRPEWIESLAGQNTILGNFAGVAFGVFMYFPTLVEVPIASMFLNLGMHRGPLLAYLMADPELSLQSILIMAAIIGRLKAWVYVGWVAIFSMLAGLIYGSWIDGASGWQIAAYALTVLGALALGGWWVNQHRHPQRKLVH